MCALHRGPLSECGDDERDWFPQRSICWPTAQLAAATRLYDEKHKAAPYHDGFEQVWSEKPSRLTPFHYRDGVTIWMSPVDLSPDDDFLGQKPPPDPGLS